MLSKDLLVQSDEKELFQAKGKKGIIMNLFSAPMKHLRLTIIFVVFMEYFFPLGWIKLFIIFYGIFIPLKYVGFASTIYKSFKRIESKK